jgi:hypothetical protein
MQTQVRTFDFTEQFIFDGTPYCSVLPCVIPYITTPIFKEYQITFERGVSRRYFSIVPSTIIPTGLFFKNTLPIPIPTEGS